MNDSRHEKSWNDPPLFSVDQMSRATNPTVISRRNRYPQQSAENPQMNQMNNPMVSTNQQNFGTNQNSYGQPLQQQQQQQQQQHQHQHNPVSNQTSFGQQFQQTNPVANSYETVFDVNAFVYNVQSLISSSNHLPQELVMQWQNIQNHIYGIPLEGQTKALFDSLLSSLQAKDLNNCRHYTNYLANDSNQTIRTIASILSQIFRYFP